MIIGVAGPIGGLLIQAGIGRGREAAEFLPRSARANKQR